MKALFENPPNLQGSQPGDLWLRFTARRLRPYQYYKALNHGRRHSSMTFGLRTYQYYKALTPRNTAVHILPRLRTYQYYKALNRGVDDIDVRFV